MVTFKWVLATEWKCDNNETYEQIIEESEPSFDTISECWADHMDYMSVAGMCHSSPSLLIPTFVRYYAGEFKISRECEFVDLGLYLAQSQKQASLTQNAEAEEDDDGLARNVRKLQNQELEETVYKWRLYRKVDPAIYLSHLHRIQETESKQTFSTIYECLLDFNLNCEFDFVNFYPNSEFILCVEAVDCVIVE